MEPSDDSCHSSTSRQESLNGICDVAKAIEYEWNRVVQPTGSKTSTVYTASGGVLRMVKAFVEVRGEMREMVFLTNNLSWSGRTIAELYRARWGIETFFKEIK